jgi:NAD(P)-dependent dehydrogenase (short-subunit alcohol dehydrogenase family)
MPIPEKKGCFMKDFKDKVAVITGAASGIGYGLAERCSREGMKVVLADVEEGALARAENDIKAMGVDTLAVKTDVSKADDVKALADKTLDAFGAVHLLCNNAGVTVFSTTWESKLADWQWVLGVNLWGVIHGVHFFVPIMLKQNTECHIVNTASIAGLCPGLSGPYEVSKHGVVVLSETLYHQLGQIGSNIGVSVLCPGAIRTKVLDCERNRPKELRNQFGENIDIKDPGIQAIFQANIQMIEKGMPPHRVADITFRAVRKKKFYILPNAEQYIPTIQKRMEDIINQRNPATVQLDLT